MSSRRPSEYPGNGSEREALIRENAWLVERVVGRLMPALPGTVDQDELVSHGILGLLEAIDGFDPESGTAFEKLATTAIRRAVLDELRLMAWGQSGMEDECRRVEGVLIGLEMDLGRPPEEEEIAAGLQTSVEEYRELLSRASGVALMSMSSLLSGGEAAAPELRSTLAAAIGALPRTEQLIVALYYHEELMFGEVGDLLGASEARVCEIHAQALLRLRGKLGQ